MRTSLQRFWPVVVPAAAFLALPFLPLMTAASAPAATSWDANQDFSLTANPSGVWAYLEDTAPLKTPVSNDFGGTPGIEAWWSDEPVPNSVSVMRNVTKTPLSIGTVVITPGLLTLDPESHFVSVTFTAPTDGTYDMDGKFTGADTVGNAHPVSVVVAGVTRWSASISKYQQSESFALTMNLKVGEIVYFNVDTGSAGCTYCYLSTGFDVKMAGPLVPTTTTLKTSEKSIAAGAPVSLTALVKPASGAAAPTGSVEFKSGSTTLHTVTLNATGQATFTSSALDVGTDSLRAVYSGSATEAASTSNTVKVTVEKDATKTTLAAKPSAVTFGTPVEFTVTVKATSGTIAPKGTVTFKSGAKTLGNAPLTSAGTASFETSALPVGSDSITAYYAGSTDDNASDSAAVVVTVSQ